MSWKVPLCLTLTTFTAALSRATISSQTYSWANVVTGVGGGFIPGIVFNPSEEGLVYARTDIGGVYRRNDDLTWTPLQDWVDNDDWDQWGIDAIATDPVDTNNLYLAVGMYTNSWDPNNGSILISNDKGDSWTSSTLPFKVGGNMPGRGMGERLAIDPNDNSILYFGARSGNGLWKSTNKGSSWSKVSSFTDGGSYVPDPTDTSGYNSDIIGISWVTFDSSSGSSGSATQRIFVGVANLGSTNVYVSEDAGSTWSAVEGQNSTFIPHKGVISDAEHTLYVTYSNGAGPYDGTDGSVYKYDISSGTWTDITPVSGSDLYFGFGGIAVDVQSPGTLMVAALNSWWPDGQIFRSNDSGTTWSGLWSWEVYPTLDKWYTYDDSEAPWTGPDYVDTTLGDLQIGWMMEALVIDPFNSDNWYYGTGEAIMGGTDLTKWDTTHNITLAMMGKGMEETSVQDLLSPPSGPANLISCTGDVDGFVHTSLTTPPATSFEGVSWSTTVAIDYAGNDPTNLVRIGDDTSGTSLQVAISTDSGNSWSQDYGAADNLTGTAVALSADGQTVLWKTTEGIQVSQYTNSFTSVSTLPSDAAIASDKVNASIFYGASSSSFYISKDGAHTFSIAGSLGSSTSPVKVIVNPNVTGDVWVSSDKGIFHSTDFGSTFTQLDDVTQAWAISLGAAASSGGYPALFAVAEFGSQGGYFRSDDEGVNWVQINDADHGFGSLSSNPISGDPRIYGRVYVGTNGRGIWYGDVSGSAPAPTATATSTNASTSSAVSSTASASSTAPEASSTSSSSSSTSTDTASIYGQCGGIGWTGPTECASGSSCTFSNDYYSQCIPS